LADTVTIEVEGRRLQLSNLDKVLWPDTGFSKAQMLDYYTRIAPAMLPHLRGRALTLKRYPDGVDAKFFYEKECPRYHPDFVEVATAPSRNERHEVNYCVADETATLVWLANLATVEFHTLLSLGMDFDRPTYVAFDLDPGPPAGVLDAAWAAERLNEVLGDLGLECFAKVSGSKGVHVFAPLNTPVTFDETKAFAHGIARLLEKQHPRRVVSNMRKDLREGKVFVDWSQNDSHKTTVCAYSLRAKQRPTVSAPVSWEELAQARRRKRASDLQFETSEVLRRVEDRGDLFEPVLRLEQRLP
jgi:bifunctional non-homologous end joining protein LigD